MKRYEVKVTREDKWWMVEIPELDGLTQARRLSEVGQMAREWIALNEDLARSEVDVEVLAVDVAGMDVHAIGDLVQQLRRDVGTLEALIGQLTAVTAKRLVGDGVPVRDIAEVLGLSYQRVSQIVGASEKVRVEVLYSDTNVLMERFAQVQKALAPLAAFAEEMDATLAPLRTQAAAVEKALGPLRKAQAATSTARDLG